MSEKQSGCQRHFASAPARGWWAERRERWERGEAPLCFCTGAPFPNAVLVLSTGNTGFPVEPRDVTCTPGVMVCLGTARTMQGIYKFGE